MNDTTRNYYQVATGFERKELYNHAANVFLQALTNGYHYAENELGQLCRRHKKVNFELVFNLHRKEAEEGNARAQFMLATLYKVSQKDEGLAQYWYTQSAEAGYGLAQHTLGMQFYSTDNYERSIFWFRKAADTGIHNSRERLGSIIQWHYQPAKNATEALEYRKDFEQREIGEALHVLRHDAKSGIFESRYHYAAITNDDHNLIKAEPRKFLDALKIDPFIDNKRRFIFLKKLMIQETRSFLGRFFLNKSTKRDPDLGMEIADHQYAYLSQLLKAGHDQKEAEKTMNLLTKLLNTIPNTHERYAEAELMLSHIKFMRNDATWKTNFNTCRKHDVEGKLLGLEGITQRIRKNVLNTYKDANRAERKEQRKTELKKIGENKYDIQALFRLSLISPKRRANCEATIRALNPESSFLQPQLT